VSDKITTNEYDGRPTETLTIPNGTVWRWKVLGYALGETADLWLETTLSGAELLSLLEPGTDNEEFLGTLYVREVVLTVESQVQHGRVLHHLKRKNPGGINSLRWHLRALAVELGEEVEDLERLDGAALSDQGLYRLESLKNVLEQIKDWPEDETE
jgi:hypothetical protein